MSTSFDQLRRQQFLTRQFYESQLNQLDSITPELLGLYQAHPDKIEQLRSWSYQLADDSYKLLLCSFCLASDLKGALVLKVNGFGQGFVTS